MRVVALMLIGTAALFASGCGSDGPLFGSGGAPPTSSSYSASGDTSASSSAASAAASSSSSVASTSSTGAGSECKVPTDCPGVDADCVHRECNNGYCAVVYPKGTPIGSQVSGDCAVQVCDGAGGLSKVYDSTDVVQVVGDCKKAACVAIGSTSTSPDDSDAPPQIDCNTVTCVAGKPIATPIADGSACAAGLCSGGTCKAHIWDCCNIQGLGPLCVCGGVAGPNTFSVSWVDAMNAQHSHNGSDAACVDYCAPGTKCSATNYGTHYSGVCQ